MAHPDFTIADVLAWARTKPADEEYDFQLTGGCALCQFLSDSGRAKKPLVAYGEWEDNEGPARGEIEESLNCALGYNLTREQWTFGKLVERLKTLCPETPVTKSDWLAIDAYLTETVSA